MDKRVICLFGPQGSGKGTQAKLLTKKLNIPHISMGDLFRMAIESGTELGRKVKEVINQGDLAPDGTAFNLLKERVSNIDCANGFILDGFPRTLKQAGLLDEYIEVDKVVVIDISNKESIKRLASRRHCLSCGSIYNLYTVPKPKEDEMCDRCHKKLYQRDDDKEEAVAERLKKYHEETEPLIDYYKNKGKNKVAEINGEQSIEKVAEDINEAIE
ncbi:adenylate kinase [Candidatus Falkowbacteria bacterium CG10_big_fil_rev_8_21_14_0_10_43_10]|uniref:Adenylate kinase n=1 Tax=Candidatus Falkowbacteria bacterium CG10_big_fil_rev_8_21_14_0_10_43_10 TaxID=1974567 RepID=A0A2H0V322_9BACT|nr:MAG: adenylate kinase [Candidatus Falkowbacteria bacterium CG10_big_fil_rev_8_21_14_0_10_43_10]